MEPLEAGATGLGERVALLREERGWSQGKLAAEASRYRRNRNPNYDGYLSRPTVVEIESGDTESPGADVVVALALALDTTTDYLLLGRHPKDEPPVAATGGGEPPRSIAGGGGPRVTESEPIEDYGRWAA